MPVAIVIRPSTEKYIFDPKMRYTRPTQFPHSVRQTMQGRSSRTGNLIAFSKLFPGSRAPSRTAFPALRESLQPCRVGLVLLAFAVAFFSYGYRASLFQYRSVQAKNFPIARAIVEQQRFGISSASAHHGRHWARRQFDNDHHAQFEQASSSAAVLSTNAQIISAPPRLLPFFDSSLPLRSPPSLAA
jgi:hypothetical protein